MASNFWNSTHFKRWLFTKEHIRAVRERQPPGAELTQRNLVYAIQSVGRALRFDQIVIATAVLFFRRVLFKEFTPYVIIICLDGVFFWFSYRTDTDTFCFNSRLI